MVIKIEFKCKHKMSNVKLKLKHFIIGILLTLNLIRAMPLVEKSNVTTSLLSSNYSNNFFSNNYETAIINKTDEINILNLPVDPESDTLIVADRDESENLDPGGEALEKHNPAMVDAIIDAEHDRDVTMSKITKKKKEVTVLEISDEDVDEFRKQLNISSSVLDDIMEAETGRDETLTDIMFAPDEPQFAFLAAPNPILYMNNSKDLPIKINASVTFKELDYVLSGVNSSNGDKGRKIDYVELVEVMKPTQSMNNSAYQLGNVTVHELENDVPDTILSVFAGFTDVQTLFLALFATLLPLLLVLLALLLIRCICRRWCATCCPAPEDDSSVSEASEVEKVSDQINGEYKMSNATSRPNGEHTVTAQGGAHPPHAANGSIITMTLENNHLIVETEERSDITKNSRETKMKYSPDNDGIFVVEVQQSTAYRPSNNSQSPPHVPISSNQHALVHRAPEDVMSSTEEILDIAAIKYGAKQTIDKEKPLALSSTGLSISDLSMSSIGSHNPSYSYGSQTGYEQGPFGYPVYPGYDVPREPSIEDGICHDNSREPLLSKTPTDPDKPVVTAAIFKQDSIIVNDILQGPGYCIEGSTDGPLLSDVQAREVSLHHLHDKMDKKLENGQVVTSVEGSPKKHFNRADSLPPRLGDDEKSSTSTGEQNLETIGEDEEKTIKDLPKVKRASLPTITTEIYESVKDTIIPKASPKFEMLTNASSPMDGNLTGPMPPPLITITEEYDNPGYQNDVQNPAS